MKQYLFMQPLTLRLVEPLFFNRLVAIALRALAVFFLLLSVVTFFQAGKTISNLPANAILGGVIFLLLFVIAVYAALHAIWLRAEDVAALPAQPLPTLPIATLLLRLAGEAYAAYVGILSIAGGIFIWFSGRGVHTLLRPLPKFFPVYGDTSFMGGILFMFGGVVIAFAVLFVSYLLADIVTLMRTRAKSGT